MIKRRFLGIPFPILIVVIVILLVLTVVGFAIGPMGQALFGDIGLPEWLSIAQPSPELPAEVVFHIFGFPIPNSVIAAWITIAFLVALSYTVTHRMKLVPGRLQAVFELMIGGLFDLCRSAAGEKNARRFLPIVATIFLFVAFNAWISLLPGFGSITVNTAEGEVHLLRAANTDINMPLAMAMVSFIMVELTGLRVLGIHYLSRFYNFGEFWRGLRQIFRGKIKDGALGLFAGMINIFTGIIEGLTAFIRIVSLTFRLFGNMTAGEILLLVAAFLMPWLFAIPFYGLELLIGFIQALIFAGLILIFLTVAVTPHQLEGD